MEEEKKNYNYNYNNGPKKNNIFILTNDNYYFIFEKKFVKNTLFFKKLFESDSSAGHLKNPIFLQKITSIHFKYIIQYLKYIYYNKDKKFNIPDVFNVNDVYHYFPDDKEFIKDIYNNYRDIKKLEDLIITIEYIGVPNLYNKIKTYYNFLTLFKDYQEKN